ncbi:AP-3 complex subunit sigma [Cucumis melo var. makuwa]|uniref:AP-3 complex subunit sigma n=1 Tax=Cucumis melo var. makuwa TaxID=1194695 RepID=A0A5A7UR76_CUCMM|nr:AP-3 complex subunit sigma [Cucumis melo var. makuwa]TYK23419.1 AP-3 complex subunit sigma [Cucumis melo var. makuwa]
MIRSVIVMNTEGKPRFAKFYDFQPIEKQQELIRSVYGVLCSRAENISNFVEAESIFGSDSRLVYKHFATLYFVLVFNSSENELAMLDLIQGWKQPQILSTLSQKQFLVGGVEFVVLTELATRFRGHSLDALP